MKKRRKGLEALKRRYGRLFVLHWEIGLIVFFIVPILSSLRYSFSQVTLEAGGVKAKFVGLQYYRYIFTQDANYLQNLKDALFSIAYSLPITLVLSLLLAIVLNQKFRGRLLARAVFFLPVIIASGVVMDLMRSDSIQVPLFTAVSEGGSGLIDFQEILENLNMPESVNAIFTTFFGNVFNLIWNCGIQTVLFIAGLQAIPSTLYEVSRVEGATAWEEFWFITFPALGRVTLLVLIYTMIELFVSIDNPIMKQAYAVIQDQQIYDRSSAMLWAYFVVVGLLLSVVFWLYWRFRLKRWE